MSDRVKGIVDGHPETRKMTIDSLMEGWARWCAIREDKGLGYAASALNRLMSGDVVSGMPQSVLPYGIDPDSAYARVDTAVCNLPDLHRLIVTRHYMRIGLDKDKAQAIGCSLRTYYRYLDDAKIILILRLNDLVKFAA